MKNLQILLFMVYLNNPSAFAQLGFCAGNSGDPVFMETFGTGATDGPQLPAGTTTYQYVGSATPYDGEYTISSTSDYFDWHNIPDHTSNDVNGKMFIVNADFTAGEFYRQNISGLCESTSYEFSAWLINLHPVPSLCGTGLPINVKFQIWDITDTTLLASGDTGNIPVANSPFWQRYGLTFQTLPAQTSVILKMINNGNGGCGNDLAIDDIVFKSCGDTVVLENNNGSNSFEACENEMTMSVPLTAIPDFSVFSTHAYQWQVSSDAMTWSDIPGATSNTLDAPAPIPSGTLSYRVKFAESANNLQNSSCNSLSDAFVINILPLVTPTFNATPAICIGDTFSLPTTSTNNISGSWSPTPNNTTTTTYTFTPNPGQCATAQTMTVVVEEPVEPLFNNIPPICTGDNFSLPTTSLNNIVGTWSPAPNNTATTMYTFTPNAGECATIQNLTVEVNQPITPAFDPIGPICSGDTFVLPTISKNTISGTWSPAPDNTNTTTYTFTPSAGSCATNQTLTVTVNPPTTPTFNAVAPICSEDNLSPLPPTSNNNITGTWSPALDNTATTVYTFTPNVGQCATTQTLTISINPILTPAFDPINPICSGDTISPLPTTSLNNITGTWSPALNNTTTTTYTFSPTVGECATNQTLTIIVNHPEMPIFDSVSSICSGDMLLPLPTTSNNNITGTWSPSLDNTTTTTYTFTPNAGECPITASLTIIVNPLPPIDLDDFFAICTNTNGTEISQTAIIDTNLSAADYSFEWTNSLNELVGTESSYTPIVGDEYSLLVTNLSTRCQNTDIVTVNESSPPQLTLTFTSPSFSDNGSITVAAIGNGDYEFNLDDGPWQNNPDFFNVSAGTHKVLARDKKGCGFSSIEVCLIGAPRFFTPNGDNINETWNVKEISCLEYANIYIFDRFGKLLKEFDLNSPGWNGTFNGELLQTNDYWYVIKYQETFSDFEKEHSGHFTLKR